MSYSQSIFSTLELQKVSGCVGKIQTEEKVIGAEERMDLDLEEETGIKQSVSQTLK